MTAADHRWTFLPDFDLRAFGWRADKKAATRLRAALKEIERAAKTEPELGRQGALLLLGRLWPAIQQVNRSAGDLDEALGRVLPVLREVLLGAPEPLTDPALDGLLQAIEADYGDVLDPIAAHFGAFCGSKARARARADALVGGVRAKWHVDPEARCPMAVPLLSAMHVAGRGEQLLAMLSIGGPKGWAARRFGAAATLKAQGPEAALAYAEACADASGVPEFLVRDHAGFCERVLLDAGRAPEAFERYALVASVGHTRLARFQTIARKYPRMSKPQVLEALVAAEPEAAGKYFATAHHLDLRTRAVELAAISPPDAKVLLRAAQKHLEDDPQFAYEVALLTLDWLSKGRIYKVTPALLASVGAVVVAAAEAVGKTEHLREQLERLKDQRRGVDVVAAVFTHM